MTNNHSNLTIIDKNCIIFLMKIKEKTMSELINTSILYNALNEKFNLNTKDSLAFLTSLKDSQFKVNTYRTLPVEIRAIVPDKVHSFLEFNDKSEFTLFHRDFDTNEGIPTEINECIWYSIIFYLLKKEHQYIIDLLFPYMNSQPNSMVPFKAIKNLLSDENNTHNTLIMHSLSNYELVCYKIFNRFG